MQSSGVSFENKFRKSVSSALKGGDQSPRYGIQYSTVHSLGQQIINQSRDTVASRKLMACDASLIYNVI
jgi:hypothetical protein